MHDTELVKLMLTVQPQKFDLVQCDLGIKIIISDTNGTHCFKPKLTKSLDIFGETYATFLSYAWGQQKTISLQISEASPISLLFELELSLITAPAFDRTVTKIRTAIKIR